MGQGPIVSGCFEGITDSRGHDCTMKVLLHIFSKVLGVIYYQYVL